jgi:hypothetical protein
MNRYIKLGIDNFRGDYILNDTSLLGLFVKILLNAWREKGTFEVDGYSEGIDLHPGELIIDIKEWAALEMIPVKTLKRRLEWLEARELIRIWYIRRYSVVTVRHWENYA